MHIFILTSKELPELGSDDSDLQRALSTRGIESTIIIWDEESLPDKSNVLIRTVWDYTGKVEQFSEMLRSFNKRQIKCFNSTQTILWNMDKSYLVELQNLGASVVKTEIIDDFSRKDLDSSPIEYPYVLKPLFGASGVDTFLVECKEDEFKFDPLLGRRVIQQPFISSIKEAGEYSLIFFSGKYSHCVVKKAATGEFRIQADYGGSVEKVAPSREMIDQAADLLERSKLSPLYARIDLVESLEGPLLMELELIEPELFFRFDDRALDNFCDALLSQLN